MKAHTARFGFTMPEVLAVISVICVLAAITAPAISNAKKGAHETACISNLRQIGVALILYRQDQNGDGTYGKPSAMGLPPDFYALNLPDGVMSGCSGIDPLRCEPHGAYRAVWPSMIPQFQNDIADQLWADYAVAHGEDIVVVEDDHHQFACPITLFSNERRFGLHLDGHVERKVRRSRTSWNWWHD